MRVIRIDRHEINWTVLLSLLSVVASLTPANPVAQATSIVGIVIVLGAVLGVRFTVGTSLSQRLCICTGAGLLAVLLTGAAVGAVLPAIGIARPLSSAPIVVVWVSLLVICGAWCYARSLDPVRLCAQGLEAKQIVWGALLGIPPLVSLVGVAQLNATGNPAVSILAGAIAVVLVGIAVLPPSVVGPSRILLLMSALLTACLQTPMRGGWLAGGDIQHEYYVGNLATIQGQFPLRHLVDPYGGMLSLTVWPAMLHEVTGMTVRGVLALLPSFLLAMCLLAVWSVLRESVGPRSAALICSVYVFGSRALIQEYPGATRECYGIFFFGLLVLAVASKRLEPRSARVVAVVAGIGMAVTHYSTAYIAAVAVVIAWLLSQVIRPKNERMVLTKTVVLVDVGAAVLWGTFVANTSSNINQVVKAISKSGLRILPNKGNIISRWLDASDAGVSITARQLRVRDLALRANKYSWMKVDSSAVKIHLVNDPAPRARGVEILGPILTVSAAAAAELALLAAVLSVVFCLWHSKRDRSLVGIAGIGLSALLIASVSRDSATVATYFGPERLQGQVYLAFAVTTVMWLAWLARNGVRGRGLRFLERHANRLWAVLVVMAVIVAGSSTGLSSLATRNGPLNMEYSSTGESIEFQPTVPDLAAANWLVSHHPHGIVQSDFAALGTMHAVGFADRPAYVAALDPVIVDSRAWLFLFHTNVQLGRGFGGTTTYRGAYRVPFEYFDSTRPILFVSTSDVIYGPMQSPSAT